MATPVQRVIDLKLPLSWLIGSAAALMIIVATAAWNASAQNKTLESKIDQLIINGARFEKRMDERDVTTEVLRSKIQDVSSTTESLKWRLDSLERATARK